MAEPAVERVTGAVVRGQLRELRFEPPKTRRGFGEPPVTKRFEGWPHRPGAGGQCGEGESEEQEPAHARTSVARRSSCVPASERKKALFGDAIVELDGAIFGHPADTERVFERSKQSGRGRGLAAGKDDAVRVA